MIGKTEKTEFALLLRFDSKVVLTEDNQLVIPLELSSIERRVAKDLDTIEAPFVVMTSDHWNQFQQLIDKLGVREEFHALNLTAIPVLKSNVRRKTK
jgi:hypothetical protein